MYFQQVVIIDHGKTIQSQNTYKCKNNLKAAITYYSLNNGTEVFLEFLLPSQLSNIRKSDNGKLI